MDDRLWERRAWDSDFLSLPVGRGRLPALTQPGLPQTWDAEERDPRLAYLVEAYRYLDNVPYVVDLIDAAATGFVGDRSSAVGAVRTLVLQAALLHSPAELGIAAVLPLGGEAGWEWLKWLPHTRTAASLLSGLRSEPAGGRPTSSTGSRAGSADGSTIGRPASDPRLTGAPRRFS